MADLARIKNNVRKMAAQNAPEEDIDGYIASEGVTLDEVRAFKGNAPQTEAERPQGSMLDAGVTWMENAISGIPVAGPMIQKASDYLGTEAAGLLGGEDPAKAREALAARRAARNESYPASALSGQIGGNLAAMGGVGATAAGAEALGITGAKLLPRVANSALSSGVVSSADAVARGGDVFDAAESGAISAGIGGAIPVVGAGISAGLNAIGSKIYPTINAIRRPGQEAQRRVGMALQRDVQSNPGAIMTAADQATARANNIPLVNADRGGETTRALARSVANQSPEARNVLEKTASDRFGAQSSRAADFIKKVVGGNADDLAYQEALKTKSRLVNRPAYDAAFKAPQAQQVFTPRIQELMQSPSFRSAVGKVPTRSADRAAVGGFKEISNPFVRNSNGAYVLKRDAKGTLVTPSLQFWDQVKINLDSQIGLAKRAGDNPRVADLMGLKSALVDELDGIVPAYKNARSGAAAFFGAEDALEAGKKFAGTPRLVPEAERAVKSFKPAEREAFATGYASELIDRIKASGDRTNVINSMFKSQASRESMQLVFGPQKAREIEAYVRIEDIVDRLRGSLGNSTTARQLVEMGIGAGGGYALGDWQGAATGALAARGARYMGQRIDGKVMEKVATLLTSDNPGALKLAIAQAARSKPYMEAIEHLGNVLAIPARSAATVGAQ